MSSAAHSRTALLAALVVAVALYACSLYEKVLQTLDSYILSVLFALLALLAARVALSASYAPSV